MIIAHPVRLAFKNGGGSGPSTYELTVSLVVDFASGMRVGSIKYYTSQSGITKSGGVLIRQVTRSLYGGLYFHTAKCLLLVTDLIDAQTP
jgi:hypothetical protein